MLTGVLARLIPTELLRRSLPRKKNINAILIRIIDRDNDCFFQLDTSTAQNWFEQL